MGSKDEEYPLRPSEEFDRTNVPAEPREPASQPIYQPKVALAHHWLVARRGGEHVLEQFCRLFPNADVSTLVHNPRTDLPFLKGHRVLTSPLRRVPHAHRYYKSMLPFFPSAVSRLSIGDGNFVISSDAAVIKGLKIPQGIPHVCYCHSPPRYLWDMSEVYASKTSGLGAIGRTVFSKVVPRVRAFDRASAEQVTEFIANSQFVAERIRQFYARPAEVIHPPVAIDDFEVNPKREDFYLSIGQLVPYKRIDLAVEAFNRLGKRLVIIGEGSELASLRAKAGPNITLMGAQPFSVLKDHYQRCKAFIFPGIEDFGITPLEAQASGSAVIAFRQGGALETVRHGDTGLFFDEQSVECLADAVLQWERDQQHYSPDVCRQNAVRFSPTIFRSKIKAFLRCKFPQWDWNHLA